MAFSLHDFVFDTLTRMVRGGEPDYQVMQLALRWYEKGVMTDSDMEAISALIAEREAAREAAEEMPAVEAAADIDLDALNAAIEEQETAVPAVATEEDVTVEAEAPAEEPEAEAVPC